MLNCINEAGLFLDIKKCKFKVIKIKYFDFIVNAETDIQMDSKKIKTIIKWQFSITVKNVWSFLKFTNFYWQFIKFFAEITASLIRLTDNIL